MFVLGVSGSIAQENHLSKRTGTDVHMVVLYSEQTGGLNSTHRPGAREQSNPVQYKNTKHDDFSGSNCSAI